MELTQIVEALIFAAPEPLTAKEIARTVRRATEESVDPALEELKKTSAKDVQTAIDELSETFTATGRSLQFVETANGWRLYSRPEFASYIRALLPDTRPERLSPPALETLAIIAYRQPITKANIEAVRGVSVDGVLQKVIDRGLVKIGGRADLPGRPLLYETSDTFLDHFGIKTLDDLPNSGELRNIALPSAEDNATEEQLTLADAAKKEDAAGGDEADGAKAVSSDDSESDSEPAEESDSASATENETATGSADESDEPTVLDTDQLPEAEPEAPTEKPADSDRDDSGQSQPNQP